MRTGAWTAWLLLWCLGAVAIGTTTLRAQSARKAWSRYMSRGAEMTSLPKGGQPGAEYYSNGASATSVPLGDQPGAEYYSNGASATSVPTGDEPGAVFFSDGASATSVPTGDEPGAAFFSDGASATSVPAGDEPGAAFFSDGASATSVPTGDQPGAAYFSDGASATSVGADGQFYWDPPLMSLPVGPEALSAPESAPVVGVVEGEAPVVIGFERSPDSSVETPYGHSDPAMAPGSRSAPQVDRASPDAPGEAPESIAAETVDPVTSGDAALRRWRRHREQDRGQAQPAGDDTAARLMALLLRWVQISSTVAVVLLISAAAVVWASIAHLRSRLRSRGDHS